VATQAISHNESSADFPKKVLNASKAEGERVRVVELAGQEEEASWVGGRNRAQPQSRKAMERFCGAIPATRAPGFAGGRVDAAKKFRS